MITIIFDPYCGFGAFVRYQHDSAVYGIVPIQLEGSDGRFYHEITGHPEVILALLRGFGKTPESQDVEVIEGCWNGS